MAQSMLLRQARLRCCGKAFRASGTRRATWGVGGASARASASVCCKVGCDYIGLANKPRLSYKFAVHQSDGVCADKASFCDQFNAMSLQSPRLSRSDADFGALGVEFVCGAQGLEVAQLNDLFEKVKFPRRDPERLSLALTNTHTILWIRCSKVTRFGRLGQLLGFARATSDGVLSATIWDVAVHPAWQRLGLGRALMERVIKSLVECGITTVTLYAEPAVVAMYQKLGFAEDPEDIKGMAFQRRRRQRKPSLVSLR